MKAKERAEKERENIVRLNTAAALRHWDAKTAAEILRACKEKGVELPVHFEDLFKMLQVPEIAQSMLARFVEVKIIFKTRIKEYFSDE